MATEEGSRPPFTMLQAYQQALIQDPIRTKAISAGVLGLLGEVVGSEIRIRSGKPMDSLTRFRRIAAFAIFGLFYNGPIFHWWYKAMEKLAQRFGTNGKNHERDAMLIKILADRFLMAPPNLFVTLFLLNFLQRFKPHQAFVQSRLVFWNALITNWKVWTLAQYVNLSYVPLEFRTVFGNAVACGWNIYLSQVSN